jgi:hypothetical protein
LTPHHPTPITLTLRMPHRFTPVDSKSTRLATTSIRVFTGRIQQHGGESCEAVCDRPQELVIFRLGPWRKGLGNSGQLHRNLQTIRYQPLPVPEGHTRSSSSYHPGEPPFSPASLPTYSLARLKQIQSRKLKSHLELKARGDSPDGHP